METTILLASSVIMFIFSLFMLLKSKSKQKNDLSFDFSSLKTEIKNEILTTIISNEKEDIITQISKIISDNKLMEKIADRREINFEDEIIFTDNCNNELLSIIPADNSYFGKANKELNNYKILNSLEQIFNQIIPVSEKYYSIAKNGNIQYIVKFPKQLIDDLGISTEFMPNRVEGGLRATIRNIKTKQVVPGGQGTLEAQQALTTFTSIITAWQIMTIITAQHHLSEIDQKLSLIKQDLETLKAKIDNDRLGVLLGNLKYLQFLHESINTNTNSSISPKIEMTLETIERECYQVYQAILMDFKYQSKNLLKFDEKKERITDIDESLIKTIYELGGIIEPILIAINSIFTIVKVQNSLFPNTSLAIIKLQDLKEQINNLKNSCHNDLVELKNKVNEAKGGVISSANEERLKIQQAYSDIEREINYRSSPIIEIVNQELRVVKDIEKGNNELLLEFDNQGRIKSVKQLENK
ncbi:MAG: hypothetical protein ACXVHS_06755 [Methanobacterium sp.]